MKQMSGRAQHTGWWEPKPGMFLEAAVGVQ